MTVRHVRASGPDCWEPDVRTAMTRWTRPFNFLGWPAIAIGGLQIAGPDRDKVLGAALELEAHGLAIRASLLSPVATRED
jgi:hypothetical protein